MRSSRPGANGLALLFHPLAMNSSRHWVRLLRAGGVDGGHRLRAAAITSASPLWAPLRLAERVRYGRRVHRTAITHPPVFIIGHWRTGTTLVHYLMSQDPNFGFVPLFQTLAPASFLAGRRILRPLMAGLVPKKRPMDDMDLALDLPQEEEYALCNLCPYSFYVGWYFPKRMRELFQKYVLFDGVSGSVVSDWQSVYLSVLKKATWSAGGKPLLLKNPANTARIPQLLDLFPDARFIHVYRDPYVVYKSTQHFHRTVIDLIGLQKLDDGEIRENVLLFYRQLMERFFEDRRRIPGGRLAEIRYEDLERQPAAELERVYTELSLPGWDRARPRVEAYLATQKHYAKNHYALRPEDTARVEHEWAGPLRRWGYHRNETERVNEEAPAQAVHS